jgi:V8-like Glu-specific endopeptidase
MAGCADEQQPVSPSADITAERTTDPYGLKRLTQLLSMTDPPAYERITADLEVRLIGKGLLVTGPPRDTETDVAVPLVRDEEKQLDRITDQERVRVFNSRTLLEFEVTLTPALLATLAGEQTRRGLTSGSPGRYARPGEGSADEGFLKTRESGFAAMGWSNGTDSRMLLTGTTAWPWRTIAQFTYGGNDSRCSGTLIGPRHIITAAHCINNQGTNTWLMPTITPARNGTGAGPYGNTQVSTSPAPGTEVWYFTPAAWRDPGTSGPRQWDWGLLVIPNRLGDATGWMGYVARPKADLAGAGNLNRGYPSCDATFPERPAGCQTARLYGDSQLCGIGSGLYKNADGWYRLLSVSCDLSRGHSGSPVYHYFYDANIGKTVPVVSMVVVSHTCTTCSSGDNYPNWARRIVPGNLGTIGWLRQAFP